MSDSIFKKLAAILDTLPPGFPATESGVEIRMLKKIFRPDQAELFCDLRLTFETTAQIAARTGRPQDGLLEKLLEMGKQGQLQFILIKDDYYFRMRPWEIGIYEAQATRFDRELVELNQEYSPIFVRQLMDNGPPLLQSLAIGREVSVDQEALPYEKVSSILEVSQSFLVMECACKKEQAMLGNQCDKPLEVCMGFALWPDFFDEDPRGRTITKEEARRILIQAEEAGLVHMTANYQKDQYFVCNCCGCCCVVLKNINRMNIPAARAVNSHYYADIKAEACAVCGTCRDQRCQVGAIVAGDDSYQVIREKCIGCGLCVSTCPEKAIRLIRKKDDEIELPPKNERAWFKEKAKNRGRDYSRYA